MDVLILLPILMPIIAGIGYLLTSENTFGDRSRLISTTGGLIIISSVCAVFAIIGFAGDRLVLFNIVDDVPVYFAIDTIGKIFASIITLVFVLAGFFSFKYMSHEKNEKRYYGWYMVTYGILIGLSFSGNLVTMYLFYELMTLASAPLALHSCTRESIMAGLKYMFYSFCGAYMALFGIYFLYKYSKTINFVAGGALNVSLINQSGNTQLILIVAFLMILGFGVKAGCFPFHAWLPTAHPVAPAPASAFLSGIIVKGGVLAIIRVVYYCIGADFLRGTWVQYVWIILAVITIIMGSALAFKEKVLKKRFAYSTVSNLSYILLGLSMMTTNAFTGSILHVIFHAIIKSGLFMFAGAIIFTTGKTKVNELTGLGKRMPILYLCYTTIALGLIGIPPTSGVVSKWYLAVGSLDSGIEGLSWIGPVALLISALLTAGYLMPISIKGSLASNINEDAIKKYNEPSLMMLIPIAILAVITLILGMYPMPIINLISDISASLM